ncbi:MAG: xylulokinase [Hyphomicrobiales bacterium]|nr:xylulokinase [Hyphomicrobiales bacterium]
MYIGIDIGTSSVKAILLDGGNKILGAANTPLGVSRPQPLWSEQNPEDWWRATLSALKALRQAHPAEFAAVTGIGLAGQMHGATLLDESGAVLRPAILWNDGRSGSECAEIEQREPRAREITGNIAMPGFTAPKLNWVAKHEPAIFAKISTVLLPKDYVRYRMCGEFISEMSDAAGTLWLDVARRDWSDAMLAASGLSRGHMPALVEGSEVGGQVRTELAGELGFDRPPILCGGAGDNAGGAAGIGAISPGDAFISLGTSGVYFVANERFSPNPEQTVHAFCHCVPDSWHQMSVFLSAASCLGWAQRLIGADDVASLIAQAEAETDGPASETFLPYLSGERTPHNDPNAKGVLFGLTHETSAGSLMRAVMEGVAFAFADGQDALLEAGAEIGNVSVIGQGAKSAFWGVILASALDRPLRYLQGGETGPALGAARLARLAVTGEAPADVCSAPQIEKVIEPDRGLADAYAARRSKFQSLYQTLKSEFAGA